LKSSSTRRSSPDSGAQTKRIGFATGTTIVISGSDFRQRQAQAAFPTLRR
jgi:hypothetical protein